jgi:prolyl oligopeptidase
MRWDRRKAIDFFLENTAKSELDIVNEIDRYIAMPGQALAYKIGQLKISSIRSMAENALGEKFDIRAFHDELLKNGALPLEVLEERMDDWISEQTQ